jgi:hypothetical protein
VTAAPRSTAADLAQGSDGLADGSARGTRQIAELMCTPISSAPFDGIDAGAALGGDDEADPPPVPGKGRGARHQAGRFQLVDVSADRRPAQFFDAREIGDADPRMLDDRRQQQIL